MENGVVECNKKICKLKKCDRGFHRLKTDPSQGPISIRKVIRKDINRQMRSNIAYSI